MVVNQFNWLDLPNLFFFELVGNVTLAFFIGFLLIIWFGVKNNVGTHAIIGIGILWSFAVVSYSYSSLILAIIGLVVAFLYYGVMSKYLTR